MKRILYFLLILAHIDGFSQVQLGMSSIHFFAPSNIVTYSTTVTLSVYVKNKGNIPFSGQIVVKAKRDTLNGVSCGSDTLWLPSLVPNDSALANLVFTPGPGINAFKVGGNGNTIVVWPIANNVTITDSLRTKLWINFGPTGIKEDFLQQDLNVFPNPTSNKITIPFIKGDKNIQIIIYDVYGRKVKDQEFEELLDVSDLISGPYWMIINSEQKSYRTLFVKE